jgi:outer membrane protein assembly factor BamB
MPAPADWPTRGGGAARTGLNATETGIPPLTLAWTVTEVDAVRATAIADGRVFVTTVGRFTPSNPIFAYDVATGRELWRYDFGDSSAIGEPAVDGSTVYCAMNHGTTGSSAMFAFDATTGRILWRTEYPSQWETFWSPLTTLGRVYADGGEYGGLYAWSETDGTQTFFSNALEQYDEWAPAYDGTSIVTFIAGNVRFHDPASGNVTRTTSVPWTWAGWSMNTTPVNDGTRVFVIAPPTLHAIDATSGSVLWSLSHGFDGIPSAAGGHVYAIASSALESRDAATNAIEWAFTGDGALQSPIVLTATHAYVASDANVYAIDRTTGAQVWTAATGGLLSIGNGHLVVAGSSGALTAYALSH